MLVTKSFHHTMVSPTSLSIPKSKQDHKNNKHPDFQFKCRFPGCQFKSWSMRSRQTHWDDKHGKRSTPLPCEICGKTYIDLKKHMEYHLKPNEMTCDLCGKSFPSKARFDFHYKQTHDKTYPCPQCGQLFNRMQNVVNHQGIVRADPLVKKHTLRADRAWLKTERTWS